MADNPFRRVHQWAVHRVNLGMCNRFPVVKAGIEHPITFAPIHKHATHADDRQQGENAFLNTVQGPLESSPVLLCPNSIRLFAQGFENPAVQNQLTFIGGIAKSGNRDLPTVFSGLG